MNNDELLQAGMAAVRAGDLTRAQSLLAEVIKVDRRSESGWLWFGQSQTAPDRREYCFRRVLSLNPNNAEAKRLLEASRPLSTPPAAQGLTEKLPTQTPVLATPAPAISVAPVSTIAPETADQVSPVSSSEISPTAPKPASGLNKILITGLGLLLGVCLCGAPLAYGIFSGQFDRLIQTALKPVASAQPPVATQPPPRTMPTFPPTWTPITGAASPDGTPESLFSRRLDAEQDDIAQARALMQTQQYAEAVTIWDEVLAQVPEYADGYYQRAQSYLSLTSNQRFLSEYLDYLNRALADINQAIQLDPNIGDYYFTRYSIENSLGVEEFYRVDQEFWLNQALADIQRANELGANNEAAARDPGFLLVALGRCEEGLAEFNRLIEAGGQPNDSMASGLANAYRCQEKFEVALPFIQEALVMAPSYRRKMVLATTLYNLGRLDEALDQLNEMVAGSPYYCGCRYYLRALIYYDQGKPDLAQADIDFGMGQTWSRGGLRSYVLGRLALDAGEKEKGIALLQEAEASLQWNYQPLLLGRIQKELAELKAPLLALEVSVQPTPTLLPLTPPAQPPTPTALPLSAPANVSATPIPYEGTGPLTINPDEAPVFHFQPPPSFSFNAIDFVEYHLEGGPDFEASGIDMYLWRQVDNHWPYVSLDWGFTSTSDGAELVTDTGDIYFYLVNTTDQPIAIDNLSVTLTVHQVDGSSTQYGPGSGS